MLPPRLGTGRFRLSPVEVLCLVLDGIAFGAAAVPTDPLVRKEDLAHHQIQMITANHDIIDINLQIVEKPDTRIYQPDSRFNFFYIL